MLSQLHAFLVQLPAVQSYSVHQPAVSSAVGIYPDPSCCWSVAAVLRAPFDVQILEDTMSYLHQSTDVKQKTKNVIHNKNNNNRDQEIYNQGLLCSRDGRKPAKHWKYYIFQANLSQLAKTNSSKTDSSRLHKTLKITSDIPWLIHNHSHWYNASLL